MKTLLAVIFAGLMLLGGCGESVVQPCDPEYTYRLHDAYINSIGDLVERDRYYSRDEFEVIVRSYMDDYMAGTVDYVGMNIYVEWDKGGPCGTTETKIICEHGIWWECDMHIDHDHHYCGCDHCMTCLPFNHAAGDLR